MYVPLALTSEIVGKACRVVRVDSIDEGPLVRSAQRYSCIFMRRRCSLSA